MNDQQPNPEDRDGESPEPFNLFNLPDDDPADSTGLSLTERFEQFHRRNPGFYIELVKLARRFKARTGRTCGIQRLIEIVRFDIEMTRDDLEEFKVNNDYAAYYSRLIMLREPDLEGFFHLRRADEADQWIAILRHVDGTAA